MDKSAFLFDYFLDVLVLYMWPCVSLYAIIQNDITKKADKNEIKKVIMAFKGFGIFWGVLFIAFWKDIVMNFIQVVVTIPAMCKDNSIIGVAFVHLLMLILFYISIPLMNENIINFYIFSKIRIMIIVFHVSTGLLLPILLIAGILGEDNLSLWKAILLINYIFMILVILISSFKVFIEDNGNSIGYNKILVQKRLFRGCNKKFVARIEGKSLSIENGEESICVNNINEEIITKILENKYIEEF